MSRRRLFALAVVLWLLVASAAEAVGDAVTLRLRPLPPGVRSVQLEDDGQGGHRYLLRRLDGSSEVVSPEELARRLYSEATGRGFMYRFLNITSAVGIAWVAIGFLGQVLFAGRMIVQWLASERSRRSVVPVSFWWMSLIGASMLLVYFVWRRDVIGVLGQCSGWVIYVRNLWLIHRGGEVAQAS